MNYEDLRDIAEAAEELGQMSKTDLLFSELDAKHNIKMSSLPVPVDMKVQRKLSGASSIVKMGQHSTEVLEDEKIDLSDLQLLMRLLGQHVEKSKLQRILDRSRTDGDDIDFPDFLKEIDGVIKDPCTESELRRAFRVFDNDNRGKVTFQEMRKAVDKFSTEVTLEIPELEELFVHINMTKDLTFEEMVAKSEKINR
ncbi:uncharacterized protein LOC142358021 isoform X2 [Convolutriloba macropyga]|uniref:uncharacterized protein LOC142358021 isoform X2 n=1 Tax=Convolutriloba macropyga TaxID=536237 RepID=UPI003F5270EF